MSRTEEAPKRESPIAWLRANVAAANRIVALGFATVILASLLRWAISVNLVLPLLGGRGLELEPAWTTDLLAALYQQLALLIVLPLLAWGLGWLFEGRALPLTLGAAFFYELWMIGIGYLSDGTISLVARPLHLAARLLLAVGIALLAARAFERGRASLEAASEGRRRVAPEAGGEGASTPSARSDTGGAAPDAGASEAEPLPSEEGPSFGA